MKNAVAQLLFAILVIKGVWLPSFVLCADPLSNDTLGIVKTKPESGPFVKISDGYMVPYTHSIKGTSISFEMIPVPGGEITIGSDPSESGHNSDESPQFTVTVDPLWVAKHEITWGEYRVFMSTYSVFKRLERIKLRKVDEFNRADAVTIPTPLYWLDHSYKYGGDDLQPAVTMTQYAARQYTKWLSGISGVQYRLPSEAEWEYAARAGTTTAYSFGDDPSELDRYAAFEANSPHGTSPVGTKLPNGFGIHDMHGNVWEWTVDQYKPHTYSAFAGKRLDWLSAIHWADSPDSSAARGGGWQDPPEQLRSAVRIGSVDDDWASEAACLPPSAWWYTTDPTRMIGMRLFRSGQDLPYDTILKFWDSVDDSTQMNIDFVLKEGRGAIGLAVPELIDNYPRQK